MAKRAKKVDAAEAVYDADEDWMNVVRAKRLADRGWKGTTPEWVELLGKLHQDPLDLGITSPADVTPEHLAAAERLDQ